MNEQDMLLFEKQLRDMREGLLVRVELQRKVMLGRADAALQRIACGRYRQCVDCGRAISKARLQATPEAPRCIRCQEAAELELAAF